jgi:hypothetical protein
MPAVGTEINFWRAPKRPRAGDLEEPFFIHPSRVCALVSKFGTITKLPMAVKDDPIRLTVFRGQDGIGPSEAERRTRNL